MVVRLPPPPRTGIDQYLEAREWCRRLGNAITLVQYALRRYGATEQQWTIFAEYRQLVSSVAIIGQVATDDDETSSAGALPREESFALARINLWETAAAIARWNPAQETLLIECLSDALTRLRTLLEPQPRNA